ncbi:MAG: PQQ-binding-like beta-propeller repeat protein [Planctomycetes bacterium]|nr:PQQ-binding-like beta-propeller repeat protein [Planctomycetota bacterium]
MTFQSSLRTIGIIFLCCTPLLQVRADDWPMWRYDSNRSAASPEELPAELVLQWVREFPEPRPAWPEERRLHFDKVYEPVVVGKRLFVGLNSCDKVVALDTETGAERWAFYADGPVRFAPVAHGDHVFFVSDDGYLYCVHAENGVLVWRYRGAPADRSVLGNGRLISTWPARGGPVVKDNTVYFATGVLPFMGAFIHAVDADTGTAIWTNDTSTNIFTNQKHFVGVSPQGYLVVLGDRLIVPAGRATPAHFDRNTGERLELDLRWDHRRSGTWEASGIEPYLFTGGSVRDLDAHKRAWAFMFKNDEGEWQPGRGYASDPIDNIYRQPRVLTREAVYVTDGDYFRLRKDAWDECVDKQIELVNLEDQADDVWIKAGSRLYASKGETVMAIDLPDRRVSWKANVEGAVGGMIAADGKLFVSTCDGHLYCFGRAGETRRWTASRQSLPTADRWDEKADRILAATGITEGYCLVFGLAEGCLAESLARRSGLRVICLDPDTKKVAEIRRRLDDAGLYGSRIAIRTGAPNSFPLPPYLASLIVSEDLASAGLSQRDFVERLYQPLRPYGGTACLEISTAGRKVFRDRVKAAGLPGVELKEVDEFLLLTRVGPVPGSADVTHEGVDAANTFFLRDRRVQPPLGVLWFGDSGEENRFLGRLSSSRPQVVGGRMIIEGPDSIHATDIYTGRRLWTFESSRGYPPTRVPDSLAGDDAPSPKFRIARIQGVRFASASDGIYVIDGQRCLCLDPDTGRKMFELALPENDHWGFLAIWEELLVAGANPVRLPKGDDRGLWDAWDSSASANLVVMNRHNGKVLWQREATHAFRHTTVAVGGGKLFYVDRLPQKFLDSRKRRGEDRGTASELIACNFRTGEQIWSVLENVVGTWLSYSSEHDILVQGPDWGKDTISAHSGEDGNMLWTRRIGAYTPHGLIHHDQLIVHRDILDLRTGSEVGSFQRGYGCNLPSASEHFLFFRSNSAGYYDILNHSGTGNFSGFRSSCANSLVAAGGVLSAPDMSQGCVCNFPIQTSLALVHSPEVDHWTWGGRPTTPNRLGVNLGAPGDRLSDEGTLWYEFPVPRGLTSEVAIQLQPPRPAWFRYETSRIGAGGLGWVGASGAKGVEELIVARSPEDLAIGFADVFLYFAEPDDLQVGDRVFDISLQHETVVREFDVVKESGGRRRVVVKALPRTRIADTLTIRLTPCKNSRLQETVICGVEVVRAASDPAQ